MWTWTGRARWLALAVIVPLALTGCFRSAGENLQPTPPGGVALVAQANTQAAQPPEQPTVESTLDLVPTAEEATAFPTPIASTPSPFPTMPNETETPLPVASC